MARSVVLNFQAGLYEVEDVQKASYRLLKFLTVDIETNSAGIMCTLLANHDLTDLDFDIAVEEFKKELLDQHLRSRVFRETAAVRNLILGVAFSKTGLQNSE